MLILYQLSQIGIRTGEPCSRILSGGLSHPPESNYDFSRPGNLFALLPLDIAGIHQLHGVVATKDKLVRSSLIMGQAIYSSLTMLADYKEIRIIIIMTGLDNRLSALVKDLGWGPVGGVGWGRSSSSINV